MAREMTEEDFDALDGFELVFGEGPGSFLVGHSRYEDGTPMYGRLRVVGNATSAQPLVR